MADVSIVEENKKNTKAKQVWNSMTFAELMKYDPMEAAKFAINCNVNADINWVSAKDYVNGTKEEVMEDEKEEEVMEVLEISSEYLKELLKANKIDFHHASWNKKLMKLAQDNELL